MPLPKSLHQAQSSRRLSSFASFASARSSVPAPPPSMRPRVLAWSICAALAGLGASGAHARVPTAMPMPTGMAKPVKPLLIASQPQGATVVNGQASFSQQGSTLVINNTPGAVINWQSFNVGSGQTTQFNQQSAQSAVLNRVTGGTESQILGTVRSNGRVFLVNPNGILFGQGAVLDTAGFVGSTLNISDDDWKAGRIKLSGNGNASISLQGAVAATNGDVYLIASNIDNNGSLTVQNGNAILAAGQSATISGRGLDGISLEVSNSSNQLRNLGNVSAGAVGLFAGSLTHSGHVVASSIMGNGADGQAWLQASGKTTVSGSVQAQAGSQGGDIRILGSEVNLVGKASINADGAGGGGSIIIGGDYRGKNAAVQNSLNTAVASDVTISANAQDSGKGGRVIIWGTDTAKVHGAISVTGGQQGGNGGFVETSGHYLEVTKAPNLSAGAHGTNGQGGTWLLDPTNIVISNTDTGYITSGANPINFIATDPNISTISTAVLQTALTSGDVVIDTTSAGTQAGNISLSANLDINAIGTRSLTLNAHNNITITGSVFDSAPGGDNLNLVLNAGQANSNPLAQTSIFSNVNLGGGGITSIGGNASTGKVELFGTLFFGGVSTVKSFVQPSGTLDGPGTLNVTDAFTWTSGVQTGSGKTTIGSAAVWNHTSGALSIDRDIEAHTVNVLGGTLNVNAGKNLTTYATLTLNGGNLNGVGGATVDAASLVWNRGVISNLTMTAGSAQFSNVTPGALAMQLDKSSLTINGSLAIAGQYWLDMTQSSALVIIGGTTVDTAAAPTFFGISDFDLSGSKVNFNNGLLANGGTQIFDVTARANTSGTVEARTGGITFDNSTGYHNNTTFFANGANINLAGGNQQFDGVVNFTSSGGSNNQLGAAGRVLSVTDVAGSKITNSGQMIATPEADMGFSLINTGKLFLAGASVSGSINNTNAGVIVIPAGKIVALGGSLTLDGTPASGLMLNGELSNESGLFSVVSGTVSGTGKYSQSGALPVLGFGGGAATINGPTINAGDILVAGGGSLTLLGGSLNTITTSIGAGTTVNALGGSLTTQLSATVNGTLNLGAGTVASPIVTIGTTGELTGTGTIIGSVTNNGTIAPGSGAGKSGSITVQGNLVLASNGKLSIDIGGTGGGLYDEVQATGSITAGGTLQFNGVGGYGGVNGDSITFLSTLDPTGITGSFATINLPAADAGLKWEELPKIGGLGQIEGLRLVSSVVPPTVLPIVVGNDSLTVSASNGGFVNVLANDTYGTKAPILGVDVSFQTSASITGVTFTGGGLNVAANVAPGTYTLPYSLCAIADPAQCQSGSVTLVVTPPPAPPPAPTPPAPPAPTPPAPPAPTPPAPPAPTPPAPTPPAPPAPTPPAPPAPTPPAPPAPTPPAPPAPPAPTPPAPPAPTPPAPTPPAPTPPAPTPTPTPTPPPPPAPVPPPPAPQPPASLLSDPQRLVQQFVINIDDNGQVRLRRPGNGNVEVEAVCGP